MQNRQVPHAPVRGRGEAAASGVASARACAWWLWCAEAGRTGQRRGRTGAEASPVERNTRRPERL